MVRSAIAACVDRSVEQSGVLRFSESGEWWRGEEVIGRHCIVGREWIGIEHGSVLVHV